MTQPIFSFPGGLHPADHKAESNTAAIVPAPLSARYRVPMRQHAGNPAKPLVLPGEHVLKGQAIGCLDGRISATVHAPTSGRVVGVESYPIPHPSGLTDRCVVIESDGRDEAVPASRLDWRNLAPEAVCEELEDMGLVGLGGAVFPSHIKLEPAAGIETLIINGAECEPWITCDDRLMRERAGEIMAGVEIARHLLGAREVLVGIEDNKPEAIAAMRAACAGTGAKVVVVPTKYPSGGAKQLIELLTGLEIPAGKLSTDIGIQVFNVATSYALWRAAELGEALVSRVVTVTGHVARPGNYEVRVGTPIEELLQLAGGELPGATGQLVGGPLMGFDLEDTRAPVTKGVNCIIVTSDALFPPRPRAMPCIRCGQCALACPVRLQPYEMYLYAKAKDLDKAKAYNLADCIECGCCSYVCPSHIPLVDYYRFAKSELLARGREQRAAETARERHEFRSFRLEREKQEKAERLGKKAGERLEAGAVAADDPEAARKKALLEAAIERAKKAKEAAPPPANTDHLSAAQQAEVDAIEARRAQAGTEQTVADKT
ncbi:electron transport complex subunit RsxC [Parasulfuritortus cantonensis]|uniref:Ion-translocating oxidoreductase complex subunit C n=1 Tax=Parasulfuritortus cantonensis TaxID=2528202 RepID=A0A4R1BL13_9PROT|nr:electron transport complex subunit RsxC [Parasulfuritortus cantonensis]TCJ18026.1 electron transport complex subunit RsxC [Parasulfuritortus cantonensis]